MKFLIMFSLFSIIRAAFILNATDIRHIHKYKKLEVFSLSASLIGISVLATIRPVLIKEASGYNWNTWNPLDFISLYSDHNPFFFKLVSETMTAYVYSIAVAGCIFLPLLLLSYIEDKRQ
jgi:hypothetical protein